MAAEGPERQEEGHKWPEILVSVKVLKVTGVSVKLTPRTSPSLPVWRGSYVTGSWRGPSVLCPRAVMIDFRGGAPYLLLSCLPAAACQPHTVHRNVSEGGSACSEGSRPRVTGWQPKPLKSGVRSARGGPGCSAASNPLLYKPRLMRWTLHLRLLSTAGRRSSRVQAVQYAETWTGWGDFTSSVGRLQIFIRWH